MESRSLKENQVLLLEEGAWLPGTENPECTAEAISGDAGDWAALMDGSECTCSRGRLVLCLDLELMI